MNNTIFIIESSLKRREESWFQTITEWHYRTERYVIKIIENVKECKPPYTKIKSKS